MSSVFTKILHKEIPAVFIYEDEICFAILDIAPVGPLQTLVIPKIEVDQFFDLEDETYNHIFMVSKKLSKLLHQAIDCKRIMLAIEGFEVPHVHIKLIPAFGPTNNFSGDSSKYQEYKDKYLDKLRSLL